MRVFLVFCLFLTSFVPAAQAQWWKGWRGVKKIKPVVIQRMERSAAESKIAASRASVLRYQPKVEYVTKMNRLGLEGKYLKAFEKSVRNYYKQVDMHFPEVMGKSTQQAVNSMEDMLLALPLSLKKETVFLEEIPGIEKPLETYVSAMTSVAWDNWLKSGIGSKPPASMVVSKADLKKIKQMQHSLDEEFARQYAALPASQKDLKAQLSRVLADVQRQTGWDEATVTALQEYFEGAMRSLISNQNKLTASEFLQAYDVLDVAAQLSERYLHRAAKGASTSIVFLIPESIQRVIGKLGADFGFGFDPDRMAHLQKWYNGLYQ